MARTKKEENVAQEVAEKTVKEKQRVYKGADIHPDRKKRRRPDCSLYPNGYEDDGSNAKFLNHTLEICSWELVDMHKPDDVQDRCLNYLKFCASDDIKPTMAELALALGLDRRTLIKYRDGELGKQESVRHILKYFCSIINSQMEHYMQNGKINPVSGIFLMKNNMGYTDKQEVVVTPQQPLGEQTDTAALEEKYSHDIVVDIQDGGNHDTN